MINSVEYSSGFFFSAFYGVQLDVGHLKPIPSIPAERADSKSYFYLHDKDTRGNIHQGCGALWLENHIPFTFREDIRCTFFHNLPVVVFCEADKQVVLETSIETGPPPSCATPTKRKTKRFIHAIARLEVLRLRCLEEFGEEGLQSCLVMTKLFAQNFAGTPPAVVH